MKKFFQCVLILVIVATFLASCSLTATDNFSNETQSTPVDEASGSSEHKAPPHQLIFTSIDDLTEFISATELSDDELQEFLNKNNYSMNGVTSREDVSLLSSMIQEKGIPAVDDATLTDLTLFVDTQVIHVMYQLETNEVYSFRYSLKDDVSQQKTTLKIGNIETEWVSIPVTYAGLQIYKPAPEMESGLMHSDVANVYPYIISTPESTIMLRMFNIDPNNIEDYIDDISFSSLS